MSLGRQIFLVLLAAAAVLVAAVLVADGCSERLVESETSAEREAPVIEVGKPEGRDPESRDPERRKPETVQASHCSPEVPGCAVTEGRIVYVEAVDPDGDGDAHFVVVDGASITLPGLTAIDVEVGLRPHPLPGVGDLVSAAGPVQTGSYGQSQIHALEFHVAH